MSIKDNAKVTPKQLSTYVVVGILAAIGWWMDLPAAKQQELIASAPWLAEWAPWLGGIAWVIAKLWPQGLTVPAPAAPDEVKEPNQ